VTNENTAFVGSIPENYDRYLGPVLFEPYAADLVGRLKVPEQASVLEIACGTGIVTRRLRDRLDLSVRIVATDLNDAMMSYAAQKFRPEDRIEWKQADATELPFADQSFAAAVCQFGLMFVPDKARVMSETYRILKPGGTFLFNVWDAIELNDLAQAAHTIIKKFFPQDPPDFYDVPFSYHEPEAIKSLLSTAGFREIQLSVVSLPAISPSASDVAHGLIHGNPVITAINERDDSKAPEVVADLAASIAAQFGDSPVRARMQALVCNAFRTGEAR
jgi:ubiquinone/menaquinone biosynthesis C-methylase UbiE